MQEAGLEIIGGLPTDASGTAGKETFNEWGGSSRSSQGGQVTSGGGSLGTGSKGPLELTGSGSEETPEDEDSNETGLEIVGWTTTTKPATGTGKPVDGTGTGTTGPSIVTDDGEDVDLLGKNGTSPGTKATTPGSVTDDEDLLKTDGSQTTTGSGAGTTTPTSITESGEHPETVGKDGEKGTTVHGTSDGAESTTAVPTEKTTDAATIVTDSGEEVGFFVYSERLSQIRNSVSFILLLWT